MKYQSLYDYVGDNYEQLSKEELKRIIQEVLYAVYSDIGMTKKQYKRIIAGALFELQDRWDLDIYLQLDDA